MANCWERYKILNKNQEKAKSNKQFELVIFADSITTIPENIIKCNKNKTLNYSLGGAKVKDIYNQKNNTKENIEMFKYIISLSTFALIQEKAPNPPPKQYVNYYFASWRKYSSADLSLRNPTQVY